MANINRVVLVGNLTRDPELRHTPSGTAVCSLRLAVNTRRKDGATGEWTEKPNYFDITRLGQPGRELRAVPREGPAGRDRRPARVARVGGPGRHQAPGGRGDRRHRAVPRRPRDGERRWRRRQPVRAGRRERQARTPTSAAAPPTTTFRSEEDTGRSRWQVRATTDAAGSASPPLTGGRRKSCFFCKTKVDEIDYKNIGELRRYISEKGKIRSRRISGACRRHQRQVAVAVKRAREMALLPYVAEGREEREGGGRARPRRPRRPRERLADAGRPPPGRRQGRPARRRRERRPRLRAQLPAAARARRARDAGPHARARAARRASVRGTRRRRPTRRRRSRSGSRRASCGST